MTTLNSGKVDELKRSVKGDVLLPSDAAHEDARKVWNAMIDRHPAVIVRCTTTQDVVGALGFAKEQGLRLAVRGAGHNIAGSGVCDDGLVIDLSRMRSATVDAGARRVVVEAGATLADVDAATQPHGLAVPLGINSTTGIAGLTLGGGFGWLTRKYGMTVDSLESAEVVTAAGEVVRASATDNPDLFWALRGGGGNFGVVTRFEFRLQHVGPDVLTGLVVYPFSQAKRVLQQYRQFIAAAPDELTVWVVMRQAPPLPFLPQSVHGKEVLILPIFYSGDPKQGEPLLEPLRRFGDPVGEHVGVQPYIAWQQAFDPLLTPGARNYWKSHNFEKLDDGLLDATIESVGELPSPQCEIFLGTLDRAVGRVAPDATAYAQRATPFFMNVHGRWDDAADDARGTRWARDFFEAAAPFASGGVYVNFMTEDESDRVRAAYGPNYERLTRVKRQYDPQNLFRTNQNIRPA
jgi:FAD/FMN-containing dehydrogenase